LEAIVSTKHKVLCITLGFVLGIGAGMGMAMPPEKIVELMQQMSAPKIAQTLPDESDDGDDLDAYLARSGLSSGLSSPAIPGPEPGFGDHAARLGVPIFPIRSQLRYTGQGV